MSLGSVPSVVENGLASVDVAPSARHVAVYVPSLDGGGAERVMVTLANGFAQLGLRVDLVLANAQGPYLADVLPSVRIVDLQAGRVLASLPGLVRYLRRQRPEAMLSAMNYANIVAIAACCLARVSTHLVVSEHTTLSVLIAQNRKSWIKPLLRLAYPWADGIVAVSKGVADDLAAVIGLPRDNIDVIYNPVVSPELHVKSLQAVDHSWFSPGAPPVILAAGRLTVEKDFGTLIRAFAQLRTSRSAHLLILGEGELRGQLEALAAELGVAQDVILPGFVENPFAYMQKAAVFVLSSLFEGLPSVLIQAMACGVPVVATRCPSGPEEILENGRWGHLVAMGNATELASAMVQVLDSDQLPDVRRRADDFNVERAVTNYLSVLGLDSPMRC